MGKKQTGTGISCVGLRRVTAAAGLAATTVVVSVYPVAAGVTFETQALSGQAAPGTASGVSFTSFNFPSINESGDTAFVGFLDGPGVDDSNDAGIWSVTAGSSRHPALVARTGDPAPGVPAGVNFRVVSNPVLNNAGQTAFVGLLAGVDVNNYNDKGMWSEAAGSIGSPRLVARAGDQAPWTTTGVRFFNLGGPLLNDAGHIAHRSSIVGPGVGGGNNIGIWSEAAASAGSRGLIARTGDAAPGTTHPIKFRGFGGLALNGAGQTAFYGLLTGTGVDQTNDSGIWSEAAGSIGHPGLVVREGDAAPGTPISARFKSFESFVINGAGQTAFNSYLTDAEGNISESIWSEAAGVNGRPGLVARTGDAAPGTLPGVEFISFESNAPVFNNAGHTAFFALISGPGVDNTNDLGIWSEAAGSVGNPGLVVRTGDAAPGTTDGVNFSVFSEPVINNAGQNAFIGYLTGTGVDGSNDRGIWVTDLDGQLNLVIRAGELFDVDDDPLSEDLRTVATIKMYTGRSGENGLPYAFNDAGQVAFFARFTDGTDGIFVANTLATLLGDYSGNGIVDAADYTVWADNFSSTTNLAADGNGDGVVDAADYTIWADNFGNANASVNTLFIVPEPATGLVLLGLSLAAGRRQSRR